MTEQEEDYVYFVTCINNLNEALRILQDIKQSVGNPLVGPAFQFALIEYSKPYRKSWGVVKAIHKLENEHVPTQYLGLHNEILTARDKIHAHSDLTVNDAKVYITNTDHRKYVSIAKNIVYDTENLSRIDNIIDSIEKSLDSMYLEVKRLEAALPINA